MIGATVNFDYRRDRFRDYSDHGIKTSDDLDKSAIVSLAPFARYYFSIASKNRFYAQLGAGTSLFYHETFAGYYNTGVISMTGKTTTRQNQFTGEALIGFNHFFTEHVAFNTAIGYQYVQRAQRTTEDYIIVVFLLPIRIRQQINRKACLDLRIYDDHPI